MIIRKLRAGQRGQAHFDSFESEALVQAAEQRDHHRFGKIGDHAEAALQIASHRGVTDRLLAHVAGLKKQRAAAVRPVPHPGAPNARLDVLLRYRCHRRALSVAAFQHARGRLALTFEGLLDGQHHEAGTDVSRELLSSAAGAFAGETRRHIESVNHLRCFLTQRLVAKIGADELQRPIGDQQAQAAIAPAGQRDSKAFEGAGLAEVVGHAQGQHLVDVVEQLFAGR